MKNEHEIEADRLIEQYAFDIVWHSKQLPVSVNNIAIRFALNDIENTIKALEKKESIFKQQLYWYEEYISEIDFQTKVRDIVKNKLK